MQSSKFGCLRGQGLVGTWAKWKQHVPSREKLFSASANCCYVGIGHVWSDLPPFQQKQKIKIFVWHFPSCQLFQIKHQLILVQTVCQRADCGHGPPVCTFWWKLTCMNFGSPKAGCLWKLFQGQDQHGPNSSSGQGTWDFSGTDLCISHRIIGC